jgi:hypothetical protein
MKSFITRVIKSRRLRWTGHVAHIREKRDAYGKARRKMTARKT